MKKKVIAKKAPEKQQPAEAVQVVAPVITSHLPVVQNTPDVLLAMGIEKGMDLNALEKLMELQERWLERQAKSLFLQAKSDFQSEVPTLAKSRNVSYATKDKQDAVNYYYAPLGTIAHALKPLIKKYGLSYDWDIDDTIKDEKGNPMIKITCNVSHVSGHTQRTSMQGYLDATGNKSGMHSRASTVSYLQRYTLIAAFGLSTDDVDDDAAKAAGAPAKPAVKKTKITEVAFAKLLDRAKKGEKVLRNALEQLELTSEQISAIEMIENPEGINQE